MNKISVIGASSFIGKHLIHSLSKKDFNLNALSRDFVKNEAKNITFFQGNLLQPDTLKECIEKNSIVINLAYLSQSSSNENMLAIKNLAEICAEKKIKRLIHCSTVMVCGDAAPNIVDENSLCYPQTDYEIAKFQIEQMLLTYQYQFEVVILRPSAVFGPHGKNLLKLANDLKNQNRFIKYLTSCLMHKRKMNLVCIDNVIAAIEFLVTISDIKSTNIFIISDDESELNNYRDIERILQNQIFNRKYIFPRIPLPSFVLSSLCKLIGKKNVIPNRIFQGKNLAGLGFKNPVTFYDGLNIFVNWYKQ